MTLTILSMIAAVLCYTVSQLQQHGKLRVGKYTYGFFGNDSHLRKYRNISGPGRLYEITKAPNNWYYRFFKIPYREAFPLSATLLVGFTDFYHLAQAGFKLFLALSFLPLTGWIWAGVIWLTFGISFTIFYKIFSRS